MEREPTLEVSAIQTYYGPSHILFGVSLGVHQGEVVCLVGRNGAGKTTTLRSIMGLTPPAAGRVTFKGVDITGRAAHEIARRGVGFVPEERLIFPDLTVTQNLEVARKSAAGGGEVWTVEKVFEVFPLLRPLADRQGGKLSGGEQQMLTIARTLMGNPELLLLDEPTEGLAPLMVRALEDQIQDLKNRGMTILLSEQNVKSAMKLSDRAYVIDKGAIRYQGTIEQLVANDEVRQKYLGV
jgi:branched-chain amino acid transport system ATP-binding protein